MANEIPFYTNVKEVGIHLGVRKYNNTFQRYIIGQIVNSNCAEITFINNGDTNVVLNGTLVLYPRDSIAFDGKQNELDVTNYTITFEGTPVTVGNGCVVLKKYYIEG